MRLSILLVGLCLCLVSPPHTLTQSSENELGVSEWTVTLYDDGLNALVELSPSGQNIIPLPDVGFRASSMRAMLSDDGHYLVSITRRGDSYVREAVIIDLQTNHSRSVEIEPLIGDHEFFVGFRDGVFNPEMTQIALSYVSHNYVGGCCGTGGIATVDLATGQVLHILDMDKRFLRSTAWVDDWTEEGIWFAPTCSACSPPYTYVSKIWNPDTDDVRDTNLFHDWEYSERFESTGELLYTQNRPDFPLGGPTGGVFYMNTVTVYQPQDDPAEDAGQVVYFDGNNLNFDVPAHWVANGRAFLVTKEGKHNVVVFRAGRQINFDYSFEEDFMTMTVDGWLSFDRVNNILHE